MDQDQAGRSRGRRNEGGVRMITAITNFRLPKPITLDEARKIFLSTAPKYQGMPGLFRKCYVLSQDGGTVGGIYLWNSQAEAEAVYTEAWRAFVRDKYGTEPTVTYFDSPVVVDNVTHQILTDQ
jgi:hypothetical protein